MSLTFDSVLDRATSLGAISTPKKRPDDRTDKDSQSKNKHAEEQRGDVVEGIDDDARRIRQAMRDTNAGISLLQITDDALQQITEMFSDIHKFLVQGTESLRQSERQFFRAKLDRVCTRVNRIADETTFEHVHLTNGSTTVMTIQVQSGDLQERVELNLPDLRVSALAFSKDDVDVFSTAGCQQATPNVERILGILEVHRAHLIEVQQWLDDILFRLEVQLDQTDGGPKIQGPELAIRTAAVVKEHISTDKNGAIAAQIDSLHQDAKHLVS